MRDGTASLEAMSTAELVRLRADLNVSLALSAPGSAVAVPAERQLAAIGAELDIRRMAAMATWDDRCGTCGHMITWTPADPVWRHRDPAGDGHPAVRAERELSDEEKYGR